MDDADLEPGRVDRAARAAAAARIIGLTCLGLTLLVVLFWPILGERSSSRLTNNLGAACGDMVARMHQQPVSRGGATQLWQVAHPECRPAHATTFYEAAGQ
jgi:hypothetical protein